MLGTRWRASNSARSVGGVTIFRTCAIPTVSVVQSNAGDLGLIGLSALVSGHPSEQPLNSRRRSTMSPARVMGPPLCHEYGTGLCPVAGRVVTVTEDGRRVNPARPDWRALVSVAVGRTRPPRRVRRPRIAAGPSPTADPAALRRKCLRLGHHRQPTWLAVCQLWDHPGVASGLPVARPLYWPYWPAGRRRGARRSEFDRRAVVGRTQAALTPDTRARATAVAGTFRTDGPTVAAKLLRDAGLHR